MHLADNFIQNDLVQFYKCSSVEDNSVINQLNSD